MFSYQTRRSPEDSIAIPTNHCIRKQFPVMKYVNDCTLFVDNNDTHFEGKELFLLAKELRPREENDEPATEEAYRFILNNLLVVAFICVSSLYYKIT